MHISQFWAVSNSTSAMSWDYIQICALYSEISVILFYIEFHFWLQASIYPVYQYLSCSTRCSLTRFQPRGSAHTLCHRPAAHRHSPWPCLPEKLILAGLVTPPVPGPPARLSVGPGDVSGMVPRAAVPQHTSHGAAGTASTAAALFKGREGKSPRASGDFCLVCFLKR